MRTSHAVLLAAVMAIAGCHSAVVGPAPAAPGPSGPGPAPGTGGETGASQAGVVQEFSYLGRLHEDYEHPGESFFVSGITNARIAACPAGVRSDAGTSCIRSVTLDGRPADVADLQVGQYVEIHGGRVEPYGAELQPDLVAEVDVDIRRAVVGPVEAIDANHLRVTILGQQVYALADLAAGLAVGDRVTVYGHAKGDGDILAETIEPFAGDSLFLVRGVLTDTAAGGFAIGDLAVDLSGASRESFPGGAPLAGDSVIVFAEQAPDQGVLTASAIRCTGQCAPATWVDGFAWGFLNGWRSPTDFDIDGATIRPGSCDCSVGGPPELGGYFSVSVLGGNASIVRVRSTRSRTHLAGQLEAIDVVNREISLLGFPVQISPSTLIAANAVGGYEDPDSFDYATSIRLDELSVGSWIEVSGEITGNDIVAGTVAPGGETSFVRSRDYTAKKPEIEVAGISIVAADTTSFRACDGIGALTADEFFAAQYHLIAVAVDPDVFPLAAERIRACTEDEYYDYGEIVAAAAP